MMHYKRNHLLSTSVCASRPPQTDYRPPADIIEEYMQSLMLLVERQPAAAHKVLRLIVLSLSLENEELAKRSLAQLLDLLEAGSSTHLVHATLMDRSREG